MGSSQPSFVLSKCESSDIPQMISVYNRAFADNYLMNYVFPPSQISTAEKNRWLSDRFLKNLTKPEIRNIKITDTRTGDLAGFARWHFPHTFTEEQKLELEREKEEVERKEKEATFSAWPEGANLELCDIKFGTLDRKRKEQVDFENAYELYLLQVDPTYQRKGLGAMLLNYGIALADAEGRKVHLEATPEGERLYRKLGFQDVEVLTFDLSTWGGKETGRNTIMVREPRPLD